MQSKIIYTKTSEAIEHNKLENLELLKSVDGIFSAQRGYVIRLPKPGSKVVACLSGGMDSVANVAILLEEFKLDVYPYFINRQQGNIVWERKAVRYFDKYFMKRFPKQYNVCKEISVSIPPKEYKDMLRMTKELNDGVPMLENIAYPARNPIIALTGMEYAYSLQSKGIDIKTVFAAHTADDPVLHSTLTVIRTVNLLMCEITNNFEWQFIALPIERELGNYYGKEVFVKWSGEHNIPLEHSRSCYTDLPIHCGECYPACQNRRKAFLNAGVTDLTEYKIK